MKTTKVILGLAVAAAAGAAIGMLLAPEKGTDLQKRIRDGANKWLDDLNELIGKGKRIAASATDEAEEQLEEIKSNLSRIEE